MDRSMGLPVIAVCILSLYVGTFFDIFALSEGYVLSSAFNATTTELFDKDGNVFYSWKHTVPSGYSCYLLENGNLLRSCQPVNLKVGPGAAPVNGVLQEVDLEGNVVWADTFADVNQSLHHDFKTIKQPDGSYNILAVSFVTLTKQAAVATAIDTAIFGTYTSIQVEKIIEIKPDRTNKGNSQIVWEWYIMDHVASSDKVAAHPELFDGTHPTWGKFPQQWVHLNGIDYNPKKKLIVFTSRVFSEVYVIERTETTELAKGHTGGIYGKGGDLLYRWGHPSNYIVKTRQDTVIRPADTTRTRIRGKDTVIITPADTTIKTVRVSHPNDHINCLHCPTWIPEGYRNEGNIMFYHNNVDDNMTQLGCSQAIEINPWNGQGNLHPIAAGLPAEPLQPTWVYNSTDSMFSMSMSSAIRMKNGNTLVHTTYPGGNNARNNSTVREVDPNGKLVGNVIELKLASGSPTAGIMPVTSYNSPKVMYYDEEYPGIIAIKIKKGVIGIKNRNNDSRIKGTTVSIKPSNGTITFSKISGAQISIYSLQGKLLVTLQPKQDVITTPSLPPASYLVRIVKAGSSAVERVVAVMR